jgi:hypothetical protein
MRLVIGMTGPTGAGPKQVVCRKRDETWIVDRLWPLPAQYHRLLAIVLALRGQPLEMIESLDMTVEQRMKVGPVVQPIIPTMAIGQCVSEDL